MPYSETRKNDAVRLFIERVPMSEIARREGFPARSTLYKWAEEGVGLPEDTSCTTWDEYREEIETKSIRESVEQDEAGEWDRMAADIDEVLRVTFDRLKSGKASFKPRDIKALLATKAQIDKQRRKAEESDWRREVAGALFKDFYRVVLEELGEDTARRILKRFKELDDGEFMALEEQLD
jgi:transposase-like protein